MGWTVAANHGGGYAYRLAPADAPLTEETFRKMPLDFVGNRQHNSHGLFSYGLDFVGNRQHNSYGLFSYGLDFVGNRQQPVVAY